jgi:hypothetical protein
VQLICCELVEGCLEFGGQGVGGSDGVRAGLDLDGVIAVGVLTDLQMDQPVWCSIQRWTASAANTMVRWASIESRKVAVDQAGLQVGLGHL